MTVVSVSIPVHPGNTSGDWVLPFGSNGVCADGAPSTSANVTAWPFYFAKPTSITTLRMRLTTAQTGAEAMAGIYDNVNGRPNALLQDLGTVDLSTGSGSDKDWSISTLSVSGWIWALVHMKNVATQATVRRPTATWNPLMLPVVSGALTQFYNLPMLYLATAYPGSMPSSAPAVVASTTLGLPSVMLAVG